MKFRLILCLCLVGLALGCNVSDDEPSLVDPNENSDNNLNSANNETCDECGVCDDDASNDCVADCAGVYGGDAVEDACGVCDADPSNDCVADCAGTPGGTATEDMCGTCDADPDNDCVEDCAGEWGGEAATDMCGTCDADPDNDCVADCNGDYGGEATLDRCGRCVGGMTDLSACPVVTLDVAADAHVSSDDPTVNYGAEAEILTDRARKTTYLKFDLSTLPTNIAVQGTTLRLVGKSYESFGGAGSVNIHYSSTDGWAEETITSETAPAYSDTVTANVSVLNAAADQDTTFEVVDSPDLADIVQAEVWSNKTLTLALNSPGYATSFYSKEGEATKSAQIEVAYLELSAIEVPVVADATVRPSSPDANAGAEMLSVGAESRTASYAWVKFDLSSVPQGLEVLRTSFQMLAYQGFAWGGDGTVYTHLSMDDTWNEAMLTYNNMPAYAMDPIGSWWLWYNRTARDSWGTNSSPLLTEAVNEALADDQMISFMLRSPGYDTSYRSREYTDTTMHPKLTLYYLEL